MICIHHNDADGRCSAAIVKRWFEKSKDASSLEENNLRFCEMDYAKKLPNDAVKKGEVVFIVDFSFKPEDMKPILDATDKIVWIDHHATARDYDYGRPVGGLRDFKDKSMAACELTWKHLFPDEPMPTAVKLIGDYDKFSLKLKPDCFRFYEGFKTQDQSPTSYAWNILLERTESAEQSIERLLETGSAAIAYRDAYCSDFCEQLGYETELEGHECFAANMYRFGSMGFGDRMQKYPFCVAYVHDGRQFTVSLYSEKQDVDVSAIAKKHGGGGHKSAAGFMAKTLPFKPASKGKKP